MNALRPEDIVEGVLPLMIGIDGSETPRGIPSWLWTLIIPFAGWAVYYSVTSFEF